MDCLYKTKTINTFEEYKKWSDFQYDWRRIRQESIQGLQFPYEYRKGQKELVTSVYRTILRKKKLFMEERVLQSQLKTGAKSTPKRKIQIYRIK